MKRDEKSDIWQIWRFSDIFWLLSDKIWRVPDVIWLITDANHFPKIPES